MNKRLRMRRERDKNELIEFADGTDRLRIVHMDNIRVTIEMTCRSVIKRPKEEPIIDDFTHTLTLLIPIAYPAEPLHVIHKEPKHLFHPNVLSPYFGEGEIDISELLGRQLAAGMVCYSHQHSVQQTLLKTVTHLYDMLGFRFGRYSTTQSDCLNPGSVKWVRDNEAKGLFPLESKPLYSGTDQS
jgi:hypothetical protein